MSNSQRYRPADPCRKLMHRCLSRSCGVFGFGCDLKYEGAPTMAADAEICMMAADTMEALGIARGQYVVKVNNRKVLDQVLDAVGLHGDEERRRRAEEAGAFQFLSKPVDFDLLKEELRRLPGALE